MRSGAVFAGLSTLDIAYAVESYPAEDSKTRAEDMFMAAGGPAANAAVAYSALAQSYSLLVTVLGSDALTEPIRTDLSRNRVEIWDLASDPDQRPPVSSIVVAGGGSRTIVSLDDSRTRTHHSMGGCAFLEGASLLLVDGHYPDAAVEAATWARHAGIPVVLDGGRWRESHRKLLPLIDIAICSASFRPPESAPGDTDALLDFVLAAGLHAVAVTNGARPIRFATTDRRGEIPVAAAGIVDTLGAGDILHGAFCHFHERGEDFPTALRDAAEVATFSCRYLGTREWMRHWPVAR